MIFILGVVKKAFWEVMVIATIILLLYNLISITVSYFSYDVSVVIKLSHESKLTFPAVTVCNMNPLRRSSLGNSIFGAQAPKEGTEKRRKKRAARK